MKHLDDVMKSLKFGFSEVDADLNGWEFLGAVALGIGLCASPFLVKALLLAVHFCGV